MLTELSQRLREYLDSNKEGFADYIHQSDIYHPDGTINEITLRGTAQLYIDQLHGFTTAETMRELHLHLERCLSLRDLHSAAVFICLYFMPFMGCLPMNSLLLTADEQAFQRLIEQIESFLGAEGEDVGHAPQRLRNKRHHADHAR